MSNSKKLEKARAALTNRTALLREAVDVLREIDGNGLVQRQHERVAGLYGRIETELDEGNGECDT
jgi:hypothetical protein